MGGHIPVAVRRADGSVRTIGVWTNPLKFYIMDRRFLEGSLDPIDEFFARYLKDDRDEESFGGPQDSVPGEYGFVLIDTIDKVVMNWSHYSRVSECRLDDMGISFNPSKNTLDFDMDEGSVEMRRVVSKFLTGVRVYDYEAKAWGHASVEPFKDDDDIARFVMSVPPEIEDYGRGPVSRPAFMKFVLGSPNWEFIELDHHREEDFAVARKRVEQSIDLTDLEKTAWDEEFRLMFRNEEAET